MKKLFIVLVMFLAGCAQLPTQCITSTSPAVSVKSTNLNIPAVNIVSTVTTVCLTPGAIAVEKAASAP